MSIRDEEVVIGISDTGTGIPFSELERIFQPFHRVSDTHNKEGFGLGLSLASELLNCIKEKLMFHQQLIGEALLLYACHVQKNTVLCIFSIIHTFW